MKCVLSHTQLSGLYLLLPAFQFVNVQELCLYVEPRRVKNLSFVFFFFFAGAGEDRAGGFVWWLPFFFFFFFSSFLRTRMMLHAAAHPTGQNEKLHHKGQFS